MMSPYHKATMYVILMQLDEIIVSYKNARIIGYE